MKVKHIHLTGYLLLLTAVMTAGCNQADKSQMRSADSVKVIHPDKDLTGSMEGQMTMVNNKEIFAKPDQAEFDQHTIFRSTENCLN